MSAPKPCNRREAGFSLIELLVALAVLGMAAGLLGASLNGAWFAVDRRGGGTGDETVVAAQRIIRGRLERLSPAVRTDMGEPIVDAQGDRSLLSFSAAPLDRMAPDAIQRFRLMLAPSGDLMIYTASGLDSRIDLRDRSLVGWRPTRLLAGVSDLEFYYYGPDRFSPSDRWQALWVDRPQPPALIRIRLRFASTDRRSWPDLVVRPRATVNTACRISRSTGRCDAA